MRTEDFPAFREKMLEWFSSHARKMPWREEKTPYRVWISEVMLQQTRVDTVIPHFDRFVARFPDEKALAEADEDSLLKAWEGLGYYNRARNLGKTAKILVRAGSYPRTAAEWGKLPGIGPYASGSIASIAFEAKAPAVDGNVMRVLSRIEGLRVPLSSPALRKTLFSLAESLLPEDRIGDFNQSLMELGALVCLPSGKPLCGVCPAAAFCEAHRRGTETEIPPKAERKPLPLEEMTVFVLKTPGGLALRKRPGKGLLAGLWEFPHVPGLLSEGEASSLFEEWGIGARGEMLPGTVDHVFTHRIWRMAVFLGETGDLPPGCVSAQEESPDSGRALPSAFSKLIPPGFREEPNARQGDLDRPGRMKNGRKPE